MLDPEKYQEFLNGLSDLDDDDKAAMMSYFAGDGKGDLPEPMKQYLDGLTPPEGGAKPDAGTGDDPGGKDPKPNGDGEGGAPDQDELNRTIKKRAERLAAQELGMSLEEAKKLRDEREQKRREEQGELETLREDKLNLSTENETLKTRIRQKDIDQALESALRDADIKKGKVAVARRIADLSNVEYDMENGTVSNVKEVVKQVKKELPEIFGTETPDEYVPAGPKPASPAAMKDAQKEEASDMAAQQARSIF